MRRLQIPEEAVEAAIEKFGSPIYLYDEAGIRETARALRSAFEWSPGYRNFYAVKALPIPGALQVVASEGMGMDCSSPFELWMVKDRRFGLELPGNRIMFTSNNTSEREYAEAVKCGAYINIDAREHVESFLDRFGVPESICFRYNPGDKVKGNPIIGESDSVKYGLSHDQMLEAYGLMKAAGVKKFGMHAMLVSNELNARTLEENARIIFLMAAEVNKQHGVVFDFINLGGGIGIPYRPTDEAVDLAKLGQRIRDCYGGILSPLGLTPTIYTECGRLVTGPHGYLITKVKNIKQLKRLFVGVDTSVADILRPGMYSSAYHPVCALRKGSLLPVEAVDIVGSLCENFKLAEQRELPPIEVGDILIIGCAGAHCRAMAMNYNGWPRSGGVLLRPDGSLVLIQRRETFEDLAAPFSSLPPLEF